MEKVKALPKMPSIRTEEPTTELSAGDVLWARDFGRAEDAAQFRQQVMDLIAEEILVWKDSDAPRHALSVLWGKVRDLTPD